MSRRLSSYLWLVVLSLPSLYVLVASSNQFKRYSPLVISSTHWYIAMLVTGILTYLFVKDFRELASAAAVILCIDVGGYVGAYFISLWIIGSYELALLALNTMIQPAFLYTGLGALLLLMGFVVGVLGARFVG